MRTNSLMQSLRPKGCVVLSSGKVTSRRRRIIMHNVKALRKLYAWVHLCVSVSCLWLCRY